jgi:uncharacterized protein (DUF2236 family)
MRLDRLVRGLLLPEPTGRPGDAGLYGPGSVAWRVNGEVALMLGGPRALLMQLAHPLVAAGVAEHSGFPRDAWARLWRTMESMLAVSFGDTEQAREAVRGVGAVHRRVHGRSADGRPYDALDPALLLWVHATIVDTGLVVYERYVGQLRPAERGRYYREMKRQAVLFQVPRAMLPTSLPEFRRYVRETVRSLEVSEAARRLAPDILRPPLPLPLRPVSALFGFVTTGLLPPALRRGYGLRWTRADQRALDASAVAVRGLVRLLPDLLRRWPDVRAAQKRARLSPQR